MSLSVPAPSGVLGGVTFVRDTIHASSLPEVRTCTKVSLASDFEGWLKSLLVKEHEEGKNGCASLQCCPGIQQTAVSGLLTQAPVPLPPAAFPAVGICAEGAAAPMCRVGALPGSPSALGAARHRGGLCVAPVQS